mgnify:CR=1 FL=1
MDYYLLTDLAATMGYHLAMSGAETFRVEDTIHRILRAYGVECEVFAIPNCVSVSLEAANGKPLMIMRRIGFHGNDGPFSLMQLKVIQEVISLLVFTVFTLVFFKTEALRWNHAVAFILLVLAVYFIFKK